LSHELEHSSVILKPRSAAPEVFARIAAGYAPVALTRPTTACLCAAATMRGPMSVQPPTKTIGLLAYDDMQALDLEQKGSGSFI